MGHYTQLKFKAILREDTPKEVTDFLTKTIVLKDVGMDDLQIYNVSDVPKPKLDHPFFNCTRWHMLFHCTNFDNTLFGSIFSDNLLEIASEFKNYEDEIDHFIDWITPFCKPETLQWSEEYVG